MIYLDNAASAKPCMEAVNAFNESVSNTFANPSALHGAGINADKIIINAKKEILMKFPEKGDFIFTSGATESNNLALFGAVNAYKRNGNRIVSTNIEHPSVGKVLDELQKRGYEVVRISPDKNKSGLDFEQRLADEVDSNTVLISVIAVSNETGFIVDTKKLYDLVKQKNPNCMVHIDAVQGFLRLPVSSLKGDYISVSAHKIHGIKGIGGLFVKKGCKLNPLFYGGGQQSGLRPGTEAVDLIASFNAAVKAYRYDYNHFQKLNERFLQLINAGKSVNDIKIKINSFNNLPNILNISVSGIKSEIMLHFLAENEIYVSSGSACARGKTSPVLEALGISRKDADSALRISFSSENTVDEIGVLVRLLFEGIERFK